MSVTREGDFVPFFMPETVAIGARLQKATDPYKLFAGDIQCTRPLAIP